MSLLICQLEQIFHYYRQGIRPVKDLILIQEIEKLIKEYQEQKKSEDNSE